VGYKYLSTPGIYAKKVIMNDTPQSHGTALIISGCSGTGKTTVIRQLLQRQPELHFAVSCTTRTPRQGEQNGVDYYFVDRDKFMHMVADQAFLEYAEVHGNFYGTPRQEVEKYVLHGQNVLLDIDVQGARQIRKNIAGTVLGRRCVTVFIGPPSMAEAERRLRNRGTETDAVIAKRLANASGELTAWSEYDHLVINDEVATATDRLQTILRNPQTMEFKTPPYENWPLGEREKRHHDCERRQTSAAADFFDPVQATGNYRSMGCARLAAGTH
jgi:guanylate kinase